MQVDTPLNPIVKTGNPKHKYTQGKPMKCDTAHSYLTRQRKQYQGGRSCTGARVAPAEKFGLGRKF